MIITSDSVKINFENFNSFDKKKDTVLLLHGFTRSLEDWRDIYTCLDGRFNYVGIDLIGHGKSDSPSDIKKYATESLVNHLGDVLNQLSINKAILLGYSMGGRAALNFAVAYPKKIKGLILESTSAGIKDKKERKERIRSDEELASFIENEGTEKFAELWMNQNIFNTQRIFSEEKLQKIKRRIAKNSKSGLANMLRGFSTGKMPYLTENVHLIKSPVLLISGELDTKYCELNTVLAKKFLNANHSVIKNAGHNTHLEEKDRFVEVLNEFFKQF
ncbi:MAG: 2-succinyl-6-hydroxy-2,4-cyclohexadiene-1-carboxylate synthase [Ignavibacterium sp.]|nr:MAG: 2-succinyl-6-hydroxy-2,4-cyclohexadiene-1-carboxylate synthase [Ignavibacterium sp.]